MTIAKNYIQICLLAVVLVFVTACGDDDVREVEENGAITIAATANLESGRGTSVAIPVTINAAEGIQSLTVSAEGAADETLAVTAGETTVNATVNYDIPADALFSSSIDLTFTATDAKAQTATTTVTVTTGALIEELPTTYEFTRNGERPPFLSADRMNALIWWILSKTTFLKKAIVEKWFQNKLY